MQAYELWLTPLILLPGVALLIMSTSARFGQIQTEFHHLADHPSRHVEIVTRNLVERSRLFRDALAGLYMSVAVLSLGSLLGGILDVLRPEMLWVVGAVTLLGILFLLFAATQLIRESVICLQVIVEHDERIRAAHHAFSDGERRYGGSAPVDSAPKPGHA